MTFVLIDVILLFIIYLTPSIPHEHIPKVKYDIISAALHFCSSF